MLSSQSAISLDTITIRACVKIYVKCRQETVTVCSGLNNSDYMQAWTTTAVDTWQWGEKDLPKKLEYMKIKYKIYIKNTFISTGVPYTCKIWVQWTNLAFAWGSFGKYIQKSPNMYFCLRKCEYMLHCSLRNF